MRVVSVSLMLFALILCTTGCGPGKTTPNAEKPKDAHAEHAHAEHGPHNGELIELGKEEYHAELLHDDAAEKVTVYLLDKDAKKAVAISDKEIILNLVAAGMPQQFKLAAVPQSDDAAGQSSRFELTDAKLCDGVCIKGNKARLNVSIQGTPYTGEYTVTDEHDHDHAHAHKK